MQPHQVGLVFEQLIRKFADAANDTAGEQFTPRDAIKLMTSILFAEDHDVLTPGMNVVRTIYDPTAGTGGMLSGAEEHLLGFNPQASLTMFGQEINDESYAICKADMLIKGQNIKNIVAGDTLSDDGHPDKRFDYMLANPPFGVEWKKVEKAVRHEHERLGPDGRFGLGLPRISDGSMLFLLHLLSKMRPKKDGAAGSASSSTVPLYLLVVRLRGKVRSGATCWRVTSLRRSSHFPPTCFSTLVSRHMSGFYQIGSPPTGLAKSS